MTSVDQNDTLWQDMLSTGRIGTLPATFMSETTSTNEVALEEATQGAETYSTFIAETQSMGRGRLGKSWLSPAATGLYFSIILNIDFYNSVKILNTYISIYFHTSHKIYSLDFNCFV